MNQSRYALEVGQLTKTDAVKQFGIGEDIQPTIFGWMQDKLVMVATLAPKVAKPKRYEAFYMATVAMRRGFEADAVTLVLDGYFATPQTEDAPEVRFAAGDEAATEALIAVHVPAEAPTTLSVLPYQVGFGRVVTFKDQVGVPMAQEVAYSEGLREALAMPLGTPIDSDDLAAIGINMEMVE